MTTSRASAPRSHRGMSFRGRLGALDSYGILLVLIVATLFASAVPFGTVGSVIRSVVTGITLEFALRTSGSSRTEILAAAGLVLAAAVLSIPFAHDSVTDRAVVSGAQLVLTIGILAAVARRVGAQPIVSGATILAALCVYLVLGIAFAAAYGIVGALDAGAAFSGAVGLDGDGSSIERTYFSFTTLTTVGYGDIAPATDVMRMLAVTEAFTGQLYLVTVVALLVANVGRERRRHRGADGSDEAADN